MDLIAAYLSGPELYSRVVAAFLTILLSATYRYISRARVVWGISHGFTFNSSRNDPKNPLLIRTGTVFVQNVGRKAAADIEVHLNFPPEELQIWPNFDYTRTKNPEGREIVHVKSLGKREWFTIEMLCVNYDMPTVLRVRTKDGECKEVQMAAMQVYPVWLSRLLVLFLLLGVFAVIQNLVFFLLGP